MSILYAAIELWLNAFLLTYIYPTSPPGVCRYSTFVRHAIENEMIKNRACTLTTCVTGQVNKTNIAYERKKEKERIAIYNGGRNE